MVAHGKPRPWLALKDALIVFRGPVIPPIAPKLERSRLPRICRAVRDGMNASSARDEILAGMFGDNEPQTISVSPARCRKGEQPPSLHS
jgi:hypothetical protein